MGRVSSPPSVATVASSGIGSCGLIQLRLSSSMRQHAARSFGDHCSLIPRQVVGAAKLVSHLAEDLRARKAPEANAYDSPRACDAMRAPDPSPAQP